MYVALGASLVQLIGPLLLLKPGAANVRQSRIDSKTPQARPLQRRVRSFPLSDVSKSAVVSNLRTE